MSKEAAATILTHLYFTRVPLSASMTQAQLGHPTMLTST